MGIRIENTDCIHLLKAMADKSVDLMLQDLPYGVTQNSWDKEPPLSVLWPEWERTIKDSGLIGDQA
jgi:site-specific DNA-methyltransferase (adenine-specific)